MNCTELPNAPLRGAGQPDLARRIRLLWRHAAAAALCVALTACGGGGGGGGGGVPLALLPAATGAGGSTAPDTGAGSSTGSGSTANAGSGSSTGTGSGTSPDSPPPASNVLAVTVDAGPPGAPTQVNIPYVTVTVCAPGGGSCQQIDHVIVDTGSSGLRLVASAMQGLGAFPLQQGSGGSAYAECAQFAIGYTWGAMRLADVQLGGLTASSQPIQVIGDAAVPGAPASCSNGDVGMNTVATLGAKGLLGVGPARNDCGAICAGMAVPGTYYQCPSGGGSCSAVAMPLAQQLANPVAQLSSDYNGVLLQLPAVDPDAGAVRVAGQLVLGIGTRTNNALGNAQAYGIDPGSFTFTTSALGRQYAGSFVDSGSNGLYFDTTALAPCTQPGLSGLYCPDSLKNLEATNTGTNGTTGSVQFQVNDANSLLNGHPGSIAYSDLAGTASGISGFDWGLPFFFGRSVYTAIEGASTPSGAGPYFAF